MEFLESPAAWKFLFGEDRMRMGRLGRFRLMCVCVCVLIFLHGALKVYPNTSAPRIQQEAVCKKETFLLEGFGVKSQADGIWKLLQVLAELWTGHRGAVWEVMAAGPEDSVEMVCGSFRIF